MLQFDQLSYQIDNRTLVNHVSAEIHDHDFIVITGQSGSGKSLLLKLLASLLPMSAGHITLNGKKFDRFDTGYLALTGCLYCATK